MRKAAARDRRPATSRTAGLGELRTLLARRGTAEGSPSPGTSAPQKAAAQREPRERGDARDIDLAAAFVDVKPLAPRARRVHSRQAPVPIARQRLADERDALELSKWGAEPSPSSWDIGQELEAAQTHLRSGLGIDVLARLRRGHWSVQDELDLHGHTVDEAHDVLSDFVVGAVDRGLRCVRVIHGKGLSSRNREPVLKGKVRRWLAQWNEVLAYCEAPRHAGGSGAVIVLLRSRG